MMTLPLDQEGLRRNKIQLQVREEIIKNYTFLFVYCKVLPDAIYIHYPQYYPVTVTFTH